MKKLVMLTLVTMSTLAFTACGGDTTETVSTEAVVGYTWTVDGVEIGIDALEADTVDKISEEGEYFEALSCAYDGLDKVYSYKDYQITFYEGDSFDGVSIIELMSDLVSTDEGVSVGDSADDVKAAYGEPADETEGVILYVKGETEMRFYLIDGEVSWIEIAKIF